MNSTSPKPETTEALETIHATAAAPTPEVPVAATPVVTQEPVRPDGTAPVASPVPAKATRRPVGNRKAVKATAPPVAKTLATNAIKKVAALAAVPTAKPAVPPATAARGAKPAPKSSIAKPAAVKASPAMVAASAMATPAPKLAAVPPLASKPASAFALASITKAQTKTKAKARLATPAASAPVAVPTVVRGAKPVRIAKEKLVRDSFTMPLADFALIQQLKDRALGFKRATKKSELLRAGLQALAALSAAQLQGQLGKLATIKAGRPKKAV